MLIGGFYAPKYSTTDYALTYTAKPGEEVVFGWRSGYLFAQMDSYKPLLILVRYVVLSRPGLPATGPWSLCAQRAPGLQGLTPICSREKGKEKVS